MNFTSDQIQFAGYLVARMILREEGVPMLQEKYRLDEKSARVLWRLGKRSLRKWVNASAERHHLESAAFYRSVVQSQSAEDRDRLKARERLDKVLGVEEHVREQDNRELSAEQVLTAFQRMIERLGTPVKESNDDH